MKTLYTITIILALISFTPQAKPEVKNINSTHNLIKTMKAKYDGKWFKNFIFKQRTNNFDKNGEPTKPVIWYESVSYPNSFRIDRDISKGNYVIYRNDSVYSFKQDSLINKGIEPQEHLLFKGGLYFMDTEKVLEKLKKFGYNLDIIKKSTLNNEPVYIVGDSSKQFWVHAKYFFTMRRISTLKDGRKLDFIYYDFKKLSGGWVEQQVTIFLDNKKYQDEFYEEIKLVDYFDTKIYDPSKNYKWYNFHF